ncbi:MAG: DUF3899 domain-containing protein [Sporolactobacillus sp.]
MYRKKSIVFLLISQVLLILLLQFILPHPFSLITLSDACFIISLPSLIIGAVIFVVQGGFFDFMSYSFKKVRHSFKRDAEPVGEFEVRSGARASITYPLIISGALFFLISLLLVV